MHFLVPSSIDDQELREKALLENPKGVDIPFPTPRRLLSQASP